MTTAEIEEIIERLESRMGTEASRERFSSGGTERDISWSTAEELQQRIAYFKGLLGSSSTTGGTPRTQFIRAITDSGY